ncbi:MAG TPA: TIGR01548 family HAD-type hydrolase [Leptolyngbyaceae cyanobacterium M65_K2018_010]|nr:TIGR01548 family HAD-type hydrolase [Leptolyngbyaceae cyanobacterium M65_K2018_010]
MAPFSDPLAIVVFDIDGVLRDVSNSYRRALADTVEQFTGGGYRPSPEDIDALKGEGLWNNDWEGSQELVYRYFESQGQPRQAVPLVYEDLVAFFQSRYRGTDQSCPERWNGYITQEPLLVDSTYFQQLTAEQVVWGFFSGATRGSARYVLERRLGLSEPVLVAMEDAPGKPDPTGLFEVVTALTEQHRLPGDLPVIYAGDTVADMQTLRYAQAQNNHRPWIGVGVLPPHVVAKDGPYRHSYQRALEQAGAQVVLEVVTALTAETIQPLLKGIGHFC